MAVDCIIWAGRLDRKGYGRSGNLAAHRVAYEEAKGRIPEGLVLDHLCRVPACVNPDHLEAVTQRENVLRGLSPAALHARKTHCARGHEFDAKNTRISHQKNKGGKPVVARVCRACAVINSAQYKCRRNAQTIPGSTSNNKANQ